MILQDTIASVISKQNKALPANTNTINRNLSSEINTDTNHAIIITGIRRCGKSTLLKQLAAKYHLFHFLNFEDTRLIGLDSSDFGKLQNVFELSPMKSNVYLFDEIQVIDKWEIYVRQLLDNRSKVFITGSNASLLSRELGTRLTGRHLSYALYPFSFNEFINFSSKLADIESFAEYFNIGGFPEYISHPDEQLLQNLVNDVLLRDIVVRYNIRNSSALQQITLYLLSNVGKVFSYTGLCKTFEQTSINTLISFIKYLEDCYMIFTLPKFDYSLKKQSVNPKKIYCVDQGLIRANSLSFSPDDGRILENVVYIHLRRCKLVIYYFRQLGDCDFVAGKRNQITIAIQVCYQINDDNKTREVKGLIEAAKFFKLTEGLILTYNQTDSFDIDGVKVKVQPVWEWMLSYQAS